MAGYGCAPSSFDTTHPRMLSSRAVLLIGALSVALLAALALLGVRLATIAPAPAPVRAEVYAPDFLLLVEDLDTYTLDEATTRFLDAVQQQYPTPESLTIDDVLASAAIALAARTEARRDTLALVVAAPSDEFAAARATLLYAFLENAGMSPARLEVEPVVGPASIARRAAVTDTVAAAAS